MSAPGTTPGPWVVITYGNGYPGSIDAPNGNKGPGGITAVTRWHAISLPSSTEGQANARLIAAAPTLYDALDALVEAARNSFPREKIDRGPLVRALAAADEALAKARGEA